MFGKHKPYKENGAWANMGEGKLCPRCQAPGLIFEQGKIHCNKCGYSEYIAKQ